MGRRVGALVGIVVAAMLASGCALATPPGLGLVGGIAGEYALVAGALPSGSPESFEGWTAAPGDSDPTLVADGERLCLEPLGKPELRGRLAIQDQRGPDAAGLMWSDDQGTATCIVYRADGVVAATNISWSSGGSDLGPVPAWSGATCAPPVLIEGFVAAGSDDLVIGTRSGLSVVASVAGGRFLAWWPERDPPVTLRSGTRVVEVDLPMC